MNHGKMNNRIRLPPNSLPPVPTVVVRVRLNMPQIDIRGIRGRKDQQNGFEDASSVDEHAYPTVAS